MTTTQAGARVVAERMAAAATDFLAALAPDQRATAAYGFPEQEERSRWYYTPTMQGGLTLADMTPAQQRLAHRLAASGVSAPGYVAVSTIIGLENTLDLQEDWRTAFFEERGATARGRDPLMYFVSVFGDPSGQEPWGWRFGGHHVALNYTVHGDQIISPTPLFFGAHPAESAFVGAGVLRPLAGEEDLARELLHALDDQQRSAAVISSAPPADIVLTNLSKVEDGTMPRPLWQIFGGQLSEATVDRLKSGQERMEQALGLTSDHLEALRYTTTPKGLAGARMTDAQRQILSALIRQYTARMPDELAAIEAAKLTPEALAQIHFAWAGAGERRKPHYYRLQGPRFLVEYDNTQSNVNHIHAVWRDPAGDFGADLLGQHYAAAH